MGGALYITKQILLQNMFWRGLWSRGCLDIHPRDRSQPQDCGPHVQVQRRDGPGDPPGATDQGPGPRREPEFRGPGSTR